MSKNPLTPRLDLNLVNAIRELIQEKLKPGSLEQNPDADSYHAVIDVRSINLAAIAIVEKYLIVGQVDNTAEEHTVVHQLHEEDDEPFGKVISRYTRAQAIEDGELVDITSISKPMGLKHNACVSRALYNKCISPAERYDRHAKYKVQHIVFTLIAAIRASKGGDRIEFTIPGACDDNGNFMDPIKTKLAEYPMVKVYSLCGPGDSGEPVITIMLQGED